MTDPYERLGLEPEADTDAIRSTYRRLARQFHPDRFADAPPEDQRAAHERMQEINPAFAVLTNPAERRRFERHQRLRQVRDPADGRPTDNAGADAADTTEKAGGARFGTRSRTSRSRPAEDEAVRKRAWRSEPPPADLQIREFSGCGAAHWVFVHAPGGRAGKMNVATGEVTIEREELREEVLKLLRHYALAAW